MEPTSRALRGSQNLRGLEQHRVRQSQAQSTWEPVLGASTGHSHNVASPQPRRVSPARPVSCICQSLQAQVRTSQACGHQLHPTPHGPHQVCAQQVVPGTAGEPPQEGLWEQGVGGRGLRAPQSHCKGLLGSPLPATPAPVNRACLAWRGESQHLSLTGDEDWAILALPDKHKTTRGVRCGSPPGNPGHFPLHHGKRRGEADQDGVSGTAPSLPRAAPWAQRRPRPLRETQAGIRAREGRHLRGSPFLLGSYFTAHGFQLTRPPPPQLCMSLSFPHLQSGGPRLRAPAPGKPTQPTVFEACKARPLGYGPPAPDPAHLFRQSAKQPAGAEAGPGLGCSGTDSLLPDSGSKGQTQRAEGRH